MFPPNENRVKFVLYENRMRSLSYGNQSIDLLCKSKDWFLYHRDLRHKRVKILERLMNLPNRIGFTIETLKTYTVVQPSID